MNEFCSFRIQHGEASFASQVSSFIKDLIISGTLKHGQKIPNESELSAILSVSRMTVREAVLNLVQQDMLYRHVGRGTFVKERASTNKILWVCGKDIGTSDISPYYSCYLRLFSKACITHGWQATPVWIGSNDNSAINTYLPSKNNYAGYLFLSTDFTHPLFQAVTNNNYPYVHITTTPEQSRFISPDIEQGVLLGIKYLQKKNTGTKKIIMLCSKHWENRINQIISPALNIRILGVELPPVMSEAITEGYEIVNMVMKQEDEWSSLFIFDDVMALGASEAILKSKKNMDINLLVVGSGALQIPFPKPVTYLYYDISTEVNQAVKILNDQISKVNLNPSGYLGKFSLRVAGNISKEKVLIER